MNDTGAWHVEPLSPDRRDDLLAFFERQRERAFAQRPAWTHCYCHFFHVAPSLDWSTLDARANRDAVAARIDVGEMEGYLARAADGCVAGWLNLQPRHKLPHAFARLGSEAPAIDVPAHRAAVVLCFVADPEWRDDIVRTLLRSALDDARTRGIAVVDAFPSQQSGCTAAHDRGARSLFVEHGFVPVTDGALRRTLA